MKMKKILLVSGCSFTDENFISPIHPKMDCSWPKWPEVLAKKLDMEYINLAKNGGGNEYIYSTILEYILQTKDKSQIGLVMPAWTQCQRKDYELFAPLSIKSLTQNKVYEKSFDPGYWSRKYPQGFWKSMRFDTHGEIFGWVKKSLRYMISLQIVCERYNIPYKQFQMLNLFDGWIRGLRKTDAEVIKNKNNPVFNLYYKYPGLNPIKDQANCRQLMLDGEPYINVENFIGWPTIKAFGGFYVEEEVLRDPNKSYPNYLTDLLVSKLDVHPNAKGHQAIAEFLYDRLG